MFGIYFCYCTFLTEDSLPIYFMCNFYNYETTKNKKAAVHALDTISQYLPKNKTILHAKTGINKSISLKEEPYYHNLIAMSSPV